MKKIVYGLIGLLVLTSVMFYSFNQPQETIYVEQTWNVLSMYPNANPKNLEPQSIPILLKEVEN